MAANKIVTFPPVAIPTTNGLLYKPGTVTASTNMPENTGNTYVIFRHLRVTNRTTAPIVFGLFLEDDTDGTAGREIIWACTATGGPPPTVITGGTGVSVPAQLFVEWAGLLRISALDTNNTLNGIAGASGLVIAGEGEIGVA